MRALGRNYKTLVNWSRKDERLEEFLARYCVGALDVCSRNESPLMLS